MGRSSRYYRDLTGQASDKLKSMQAFGESKKEAIANGTDRQKIFSIRTYKTYWQHTKEFIRYVEKMHPKIRSLKKARPFVKEWLQKNVDAGRSAWTIQTQAKSLGKLYGITPDDKDYFEPPVRHRADIKRSRGEAVRDKHFSEEKNKDFVDFCKSVGARREGCTKVKGRDLHTREEIDNIVNKLSKKSSLDAQEQSMLSICQDAQLFEGVSHFVYLKEKGGRPRMSPIFGKDSEETARIIERFSNTNPNERVWRKVPSNADIHGYRGDYAERVYRRYERDIDYLKKHHITFNYHDKEVSALYICRKDRKGLILDKHAMYLTSKALGHNRLEIVANNYLKNLELR